MSTTGLVTTVTDELLAELDLSVRAAWHDDDAAVVAVDALTAELRRLRAENAELAKDAGRWNYYAPTVAMMSGVSMKKMNEVIDDAMQTAMATQ